MRKTYTWLIILMLIATGLFADITITGDARVRPRMDIKDYGDYGNTTSDIYYLYRARLLLSADIGDGYFFKTRLGHNGVAYWTGKFGTGSTPSGASIASAGRGTVDFMELYFGHKGATFGWSAGLIPVAHNPLVDLHFYPGAPLDLPWVIFSNNAAHGFDLNYKIAGNKLDLKILVDNNAGKVIDDVVDSLDITTKDQYTIDATYPIALAGIKVIPQLLMTIADEGDAAPLTYGATVGLPKLAGFGATAYLGMINQTVTDAGAYNGWITRVKLVGKIGPGKLTAWYDMAQTTPDISDAVSDNFNYLWLSYTYTLHKSDQGSVSIAPTYRLLSHKRDDSSTTLSDGVDYTRAKLEITTQITFK